MQYLLDTCTISDFFTNTGATQQRLKGVSPSNVSISALTIMEILYGFHLNASAEKKFSAAFSSLRSVIKTIQIDETIAESAAQIRAELKNAGTPIGPFDLLIGATAVANGSVLVTSNVREFQRIKGIAIENWR